MANAVKAREGQSRSQERIIAESSRPLVGVDLEIVSAGEGFVAEEVDLLEILRAGGESERPTINFEDTNCTFST